MFCSSINLVTPSHLKPLLYLNSIYLWSILLAYSLSLPQYILHTDAVTITSLFFCKKKKKRKFSFIIPLVY